MNKGSQGECLGCYVESSENELSREDVGAALSERFEERKEVEKACRIDEWTGVSFYVGVGSISFFIESDLLHVCGPIYLCVCYCWVVGERERSWEREWRGEACVGNCY